MTMTAQAIDTPRRPVRGRKGKKDLIIDLAQKSQLANCEIAQISGTSTSNVSQILKRYNLQAKQVDEYVTCRAKILQGLQARILKSINDTDIKDASLLQRLSGLGILYDKERLELNLSTANLASFHADVAALKGVKPVDK